MERFEAGSRGKCPHCHITVLFELVYGSVPAEPLAFDCSSIRLRTGHREDSRQLLTMSRCPHCGEPIIVATPTVLDGYERSGTEILKDVGDSVLIWPRFTDRQVPSEVPSHIAEDYREAASVLSLSPKASAALSRRCLQTVLRENGHAQRDLVKQIDSAIPTLPSYIASNVDAIRNVGNFAAHPQKSTVTGEVLDVEPGEAEWNLDVLDALFDFYYVQPAEAVKKRAALNQRLIDAGKPPMK